MTNFIVFDNGGRTADRYTVVDRQTGDVFALSDNPQEPGGVARYCGNCADHRITLYGAGWRQMTPSRRIVQAETDNYIHNAQLDPEWLGLEANPERLSDNLRQFLAALERQPHQTQYTDAGGIPATWAKAALARAL
jgi:hypothetical protein